MDYSQKISERQWNLPDKGELESRREATMSVRARRLWKDDSPGDPGKDDEGS